VESTLYIATSTTESIQEAQGQKNKRLHFQIWLDVTAHCPASFPYSLIHYSTTPAIRATPMSTQQVTINMSIAFC